MTIITPRPQWPQRWRKPQDDGHTCCYCSRLDAALSAHRDALAHVAETRKAVERAGLAVDGAHALGSREQERQAAAL